MKWAEWIVWIALSWFTVVSFFVWEVKKRKYKHGHFYDTREVVALYTIPRVVILWTAFLLFFLFIDVNKLFLLIIYPSAYFLINVRMAKKVLREDEERL